MKTIIIIFEAKQIIGPPPIPYDRFISGKKMEFFNYISRPTINSLFPSIKYYIINLYLLYILFKIFIEYNNFKSRFIRSIKGDFRYDLILHHNLII